MNPDLSLREVWQWKDAISDILTYLSIQERLEYFRRTDEPKDKETSRPETASHDDQKSDRDSLPNPLFAKLR